MPDRGGEFELAFRQAETIISSMHGYLGHQLKRCIENPNRYVLLVNWESLTDHSVGFRGSAEYLEWKSMLHHFYCPFPEVEYYEAQGGTAPPKGGASTG